MTQEALKMVLPLLEDCVNSYRLKYERPAFDKAIAAIKQALAQPEPCDMGDICIGCSPRNADGSCPSSQRTWVGLTYEEKSEMWEISRAALPRYATYATLIEANLKEKNT